MRVRAMAGKPSTARLRKLTETRDGPIEIAVMQLKDLGLQQALDALILRLKLMGQAVSYLSHKGPRNFTTIWDQIFASAPTIQEDDVVDLCFADAHDALP